MKVKLLLIININFYLDKLKISTSRQVKELLKIIDSIMFCMTI